MNSFFSWIKNHKFLSSFFVLLLIFLVSMGFNRAKHTESFLLSEPISKGPIIESVYGIGTVTATKSYSLKYGVNTTIKKIYVKEGDFVQAQQVLLEMLDGNNFKAPFAGTITSLPYKVGENVLAQSSVLTLVDLEDRYIVVSLEQRSALLVHAGQKAKLSFDGLRKESYAGIVQSVYSNDNNFLVRIDASTLPLQILPGMTADVAISIGDPHNALLVPIAAIDDDKVHVKLNRGIKTVSIKTGLADGAMAEILSGDLHEGDRLVMHTKAAS